MDPSLVRTILLADASKAGCALWENRADMGRSNAAPLHGLTRKLTPDRVSRKYSRRSRNEKKGTENRAPDNESMLLSDLRLFFDEDFDLGCDVAEHLDGHREFP